MTTPILDPTLVADSIARNFTGLFSALRASIVQQLLAIWYELPGYRDEDVNGWLDLSLPIIQAGEETAVTATTTYLQMQLEVMGSDDGTIYVPPMGDVTGAIIRKGTPPEEVYSRPIIDVWTGLSRGKDITDAIRDGADRVRQLAETDIQLAHTHAARNILSRNKDVVGFRRVPQGVFTCALCLIASTQRYHKFNLMPIHPGCDCRVAPIISGERYPRTLDHETLERVHDSIEERFGIFDRSGRAIDYKKILLQEEHGEYGPVLVFAGHRFTGPDALKYGLK